MVSGATWDTGGKFNFRVSRLACTFQRFEVGIYSGVSHRKLRGQRSPRPSSSSTTFAGVGEVLPRRRDQGRRVSLSHGPTRALAGRCGRTSASVGREGQSQADGPLVDESRGFTSDRSRRTCVGRVESGYESGCQGWSTHRFSGSFTCVPTSSHAGESVPGGSRVEGVPERVSAPE